MTNNFWRRFWAPAAWMAVLFIQSSLPDLDPPLRLSRWDDKWAHVLIYLPLGFLLHRALAQSRLAKTKHALFGLALLIGSTYGASDEIHQFFVPGRSPDWRDWMADSLGVALGIWIHIKMNRDYARAKKNTKHETYEADAV